MKAYPGRAKKFESPRGLYDSIGGGSFSGLYITQSTVYRPWPAVSQPRGFQRGTHPDPLDYHLYHGKRGHVNEGEYHNFVRQRQFPGYQDYPELDAVYGCKEWKDREGDIRKAFGYETSVLFQEVFQNRLPKKKPKLSVTFASSLVQTGRAPAEVHQPSRWAGTGTGSTVVIMSVLQVSLSREHRGTSSVKEADTRQLGGGQWFLRNSSTIP